MEPRAKRIEAFSTLDEWHKWRGTRIGASESAMVLGLSEYKTRYELWMEKTGRKPRFKGNFITAKGNELEPLIRLLYEKLIGEDAPKAYWDDGEVFSCSLDGQLASGVPVEFKLVGADYYNLISSGGGLKPDHAIQVQHQLMLTGATHAHYVVYNEEQDAISMRQVVRDEQMIDQIEQEGRAFYALIKSGESPELCAKDVHLVSTPVAQAWAHEYRGVKAEIKRLEARAKELSSELYGLVSEATPQVMIEEANLKITGFFKRGNVDYSKVKELQGVDLEPYRKPTSFQYRIT